MKPDQFSIPISLKNIQITDEFWLREMELVRTRVIPYQWEALNDRVEGAEPSYCMHNFKVAGKMMRQKKDAGASYVAPSYSYRGFNAIPEDPAHPDDEHFYGFVFQDTDFSKWIEAVAYSLSRHMDEQLMATADEAIDIVCAAQHDTGYLDTYYIINGMDKAFTQLKDHHELYCLGHLVEGAVAYYEATGKDKLLKAACRFADYVDSLFGPEEGKIKGYPGHEIAEMALVRLYQVTGEERYLNLSRYFVLERGKEPFYFDSEAIDYDGSVRKKDDNPMRYAYYQAHKPVKKQEEAVGHAVRAGYLYSGMADVARLTKDDELFAACKKLWNSIVREKLYITGGMGATKEGEAFSFPYDLPNDEAYSETCAAISLAFFARRMLEIEAHSQYADVMELALYNTVLSGMALDGKSFFYVNPLSVFPQACHKDQRKMHVKPVRQKWFGCACCPPNIARIISSVASYGYTENEDTLFVHLYMGSSLTRKVGDTVIQCTMDTDMPWDGNVSFAIKTKETVHTCFAFRIPGWTNKSHVTVKAPDAVTQREENGYLYLEGDFNDSDVITLHFPMPVRMLQADYRVREDAGKVAFMRGPITYCMEEADNGADLHMLYVEAEKLTEDATGRLTEDPGLLRVVEDTSLGHRLCKLEIAGKRRQAVTGSSLYSDYVKTKALDTKLVFVPYYAWNNRGEGEMSVFVDIKE